MPDSKKRLKLFSMTICRAGNILSRFMRLWTLHPKYLDARGLVALCCEALLAQKVSRGATAPRFVLDKNSRAAPAVQDCVRQSARVGEDAASVLCADSFDPPARRHNFKHSANADSIRSTIHAGFPIKTARGVASRRRRSCQSWREPAGSSGKARSSLA